MKLVMLLALLAQAQSYQSFVHFTDGDPSNANFENTSYAILQRISITYLADSYFSDLNMSSLTVLSIVDSDLQQIDVSAFEGLEHLSEIVLSNDKITEINSQTFSSLPHLEKLNMSRNLLEQVSLDFVNLQEIDLSYNKIDGVGENFLRGKHINFINLTRNYIDSLTISMKHLESLQEIDLSNNFMKTIHRDVFRENKRLYQVRASNNLLQSLEAFQLSQLEFLDLANNSLGEINPSMFFNMTGMHHLILSDNGIGNLHDPFVNMPNLRNLDLSGNKIEDLYPELFSKNPQLETLCLARNQIMELLPSQIPLHHLFRLDLSHNQIETVSKGFFERMSKLSILDLSYNRIESPAGMLEALKWLNRLNLSNNRITLDEDTFVFNKNLHHVDLSNNMIDVSLNVFRKIRLLNYINLSHNQISTVCDIDLNFPQLLEIYLNDNNITDLSCFKQGIFEHLSFADVSRNPLTCNSDLDDTFQWFVQNSVFSTPTEIDGDDIMRIRSTNDPKQNLKLWNEAKRVLCPNGLDIHIVTVIKDSIKSSFESMEDVSSQESTESITGSEYIWKTLDGVEDTQTDGTEILLERLPWYKDLTPEETRESDFFQSHLFDHGESNDDPPITGRYEHRQYLILALVGLLIVTFVCIVRCSCYLKNVLQPQPETKTYTQLYNEVYRGTTTPSPRAARSIFSPGMVNKILVHNKTRGAFLNFRLSKSADKDSDSVKKMIINTTSSSSLQNII